MTTINYSNHKSLFGKYILATTEKGICDISFFTGKETEAVTQLEKEILKRNKHIIFQKIKREDIDFNTKQKLDPHGTPFQKEVWKALMKIKKGKTKTYREVAEMIKKPQAVRAVANAIAKNNIAILIPCHRVIKNDGKLGEFRWGEKLKHSLLKAEGAI